VSDGGLVLIGGGEFSFGETEEADRLWLEHAPAGPIGFVPAASGSADYARHFADYLREGFAREVELVPIYRERDARRGRNAERLEACAAVYLGGGVADHLVEVLVDSPALEALRVKIASGGLVVAIAAAAQACGAVIRSLQAGRPAPGLGLLPGLAVEPNFDPGHDRRLRALIAAGPGLRALGIAAGAAVRIGPDGAFEATGDVFTLAGAEADLVPIVGEGALS
jgi:cyanophycinase-like exopeptidase